MLSQPSALFQLRPGEGRLAFSMLALLAISTFVLQSVDIVATSNVISSIGAAPIIALWGLDTVITWGLAGVYSEFVDRVSRVRLIGWLILGLAALYLMMIGVLSANAPTWLTYSLLYLFAAQ